MSLFLTVHYPTVAGTYAPILFIPGFKGVVYPAFYTTVLSKFASYGYVVAAIDPYWPAVKKGHGVDDVVIKKLDERSGKEIGKSDAEKSFELLNWVSKLVSDS